MLRANRPWWLAALLYGGLIAAFAASAYGVVTSDIWRLSAAMGWWLLTTSCAVAIAATIIVVIAVHGLWERAPDERVRGQVALFNMATGATLAIGVLTLYIAIKREAAYASAASEN